MPDSGYDPTLAFAPPTERPSANELLEADARIRLALSVKGLPDVEIDRLMAAA